MSIVSLVSGGIDSLVMAKIIKLQGERQLPLFINYGQLARDREWNACLKTFKVSNLPKPVRIDLEGYGKFFSTGITDATKDVKQEAFLPGRNLLFILTAASLASSKGYHQVAIGLLSEKYALFPDQTESFVVNANVAINAALDANITVVTPLITFSKSEVLKLARHHNLPLKETYSCHAGGLNYCGKCIACQELIKSEGGKDLPQFRKQER